MSWGQGPVLSCLLHIGFSSHREWELEDIEISKGACLKAGALLWWMSCQCIYLNMLNVWAHHQKALFPFSWLFIHTIIHSAVQPGLGDWSWLFSLAHTESIHSFDLCSNASSVYFLIFFFYWKWNFHMKYSDYGFPPSAPPSSSSLPYPLE